MFFYGFDNNNGDILVYKNGCFIFKVGPCKPVCESVICVANIKNLMLNVGSSNSNIFNRSFLWSFRLGYINKKWIAKVQMDGILESFDLESNDV